MNVRLRGCARACLRDWVRAGGPPAVCGCGCLHGFGSGFGCVCACMMNWCVPACVPGCLVPGIGTLDILVVCRVPSAWMPACAVLGAWVPRYLGKLLENMFLEILVKIIEKSLSKIL